MPHIAIHGQDLHYLDSGSGFPVLFGESYLCWCPTLVAVGRHDRPRPVRESQALADGIVGARLEIIEGAGHISSLEQPKRVLAMLESFLSSTV